MTIIEHIAQLQAIAAKNPNLIMQSPWVPFADYAKIGPMQRNYEIGHVKRIGPHDDVIEPCEAEKASVLLVT